MIVDNVIKAYPEYTAAQNCQTYYTEQICNWYDIYSGRPPWEKVAKSGLYSQGKRSIAMMNTAKVLCDYLADLTFSEQCEVTVSDTGYQKYLDDTFNRCGFWRFLPEFLSKTYALGGGALKVYADNNVLFIDYVSAENFAPLEWMTNAITAGAFQTHIRKGEYYYTLIEAQNKNRIEHKLFKGASYNDLGKPCATTEVFPNLADSITINGIEKPLFSYFRPNCSNNTPDVYLPLGISVFANSVDTLEALDIALDSFSREFVLGKKRIIVPSSCIQTVTDTDTGETKRYFDSADEVYVALKADETEQLKITDNTAELRVEEHISAINALLNILCMQTGLSSGSLSFDAAQGVKTATEVVSQESKTQRTVKGNKNILTETIEATVHGIFALAAALGQLPKKDYELSVSWQDNVIVDDNTLIDNTIKLYSAGLIDLQTAVMRVNKCDEKTADGIVQKINAGAAMGTADFFGETNAALESVPNENQITEKAEKAAGKQLIGVSKEEAKNIIEGAE